jgi:hypothetical protein
VISRALGRVQTENVEIDRALIKNKKIGKANDCNSTYMGTIE